MVDDNLLSPAAVADPHPVLAGIRDADPVFWSERYRSWILTRYADVQAALRDPRFSADRITPYLRAQTARGNADPATLSAFAVLRDWMVFKDPPDHTRLRRLLHRAFTPRAVDDMSDLVRLLTDDLLDPLAAERGGEIDVIGSFAYPLTATVIAEMLGVPREDRDRFKQWSDRITALVFGAMEDPGRHARTQQAMSELTAYLSVLVDRYARRPAPNLISALVRARDEGDALSHDEVIATCALLLFAGHETTTNLIGNGLLALLRHPHQLEALRTGRASVHAAVEEFLRYDGPSKIAVRVLAEDVTVRGRRLAAGSRVFLAQSAANRDPDVFERPDALDIARADNPHLGFGFGIHYCLGAPLARLEASIAVPAVLRRLPGLALATGDLSWQPVLVSRGLEKLPVTYGD